jgi:hypothetical protein
MRTTVVTAVVMGACLAACGLPQSPGPGPTPLPTPTVPRGTPVPTLDPATEDIQDAFLSNVNDVTSEVEDLAMAQCADIATETSQNPTEVAQIHAFAATLQRAGTSQAALQSDEVKAALNAMNQAINHLDSSLNTCGLKTS